MRYTQPMRSQCVTHHFEVQKDKGQSHMGHLKFCCVRSMDSSVFDRITWYVAYIYNMVCSALFLQLAFYTVHWANVIHVRKPSFVIIPAIFLANIVNCYFKYTQQWNKTLFTEGITLRASDLHNAWATILNPFNSTWEGIVSCPVFRTKGQGQDHMGCFKFWRCPLCGFIPIWLNHFIYGIHMTHEGMMWSFSGSKVKGQGHTGCSIFFNLVCSMACSLFDQITSHEPYIQHMVGAGMLRTIFCHLSALWLHANLTGLWRLRGATAIRSLDLLVRFMAIGPFFMRFSKFDIWPWQVKVKVLVKVKIEGHIWVLASNRKVGFLFPGNRPTYSTSS